MTVPELLQLYAPLAGMLVLAFWVGALSQRVKSLEVVAADNKEMEKAMIRLVVLVEQLTRRVDDLGKELSWLTTVPPEVPGPPRRRRRASPEESAE